MHAQENVLDPAYALRARRRKVDQTEHHVARRPFRRAHDGRFLTDHEARERIFRFFLRIDGGDDLSGTKHDAAVGKLADFVEFVRNEENRNAFRCEFVQRHKELSHGLGRQNRSRFVENQKLRMRHEGANDFDALTLAHGEVVYHRFGIHFEAVVSAESTHFRGDRLERHPFGKPQSDVFRHGERLKEREVLMHHGDPQVARLRRTRHGQRYAVKDDLPFVRRSRAVDDFHERGFAGAVFAEDGQNFARGDFHGHVIVGDDARIPLGNVA